MDVWSILERARQRWPDRPAVVDGDLRLNYAEFARRVEGLAAGLAVRGVRAGDRVAILAPNGSPYLEAYYAAGGLGAVLVPLHGRLSGIELEQVLVDSDPRAALVASEVLDRWSSGTSSLEDSPALITIGVTDGPDRYEDLVTSGAELMPADVPEESVAQLYYTSGSTGRPKGVMLTHRNVCSHALAATSELDLAEDDAWGHIAPMFHLADAWATFAMTWVGGLHVMSPRFEARACLELMARERVTVTNLVPTMLRRMLALPMENGPGTELRMLLTGGAPIDLETVRQATDRFGCEYVQTYGMTETSPYLTLSRLRAHHYSESQEEQLRRRARTGRPFETVDLQVVDEEGRQVPWDDREVGEIRVRGETVSPGYWRRPEETNAAYRDGWLYTGDMARIDAEGYVQIVDRKKDMILTGGENVFCVEVEAALLSHPAVLEAAVFGVPSTEWGEEVRAAVSLTSEASPEELQAHCRELIADFKCPRRIEVMEDLPRTASGKIHKARLREDAGS